MTTTTLLFGAIGVALLGGLAGVGIEFLAYVVARRRRNDRRRR